MRANWKLWVFLWKLVRREPAANFLIGLEDLVFHIEAFKSIVQIVKIVAVNILVAMMLIV